MTDNDYPTVHFLCGHTGPTRGTGGNIDRPCIYCAVTPAYCDNGRYRQVHAPSEHPFSYDHIRDCEMCATRIP